MGPRVHVHVHGVCVSLHVGLFSVGQLVGRKQVLADLRPIYMLKYGQCRTGGVVIDHDTILERYDLTGTLGTHHNLHTHTHTRTHCILSLPLYTILYKQQQRHEKQRDEKYR